MLAAETQALVLQGLYSRELHKEHQLMWQCGCALGLRTDRCFRVAQSQAGWPGWPSGACGLLA